MRAALLLALAAGCAEPFAVQREVLGPFRIAAVGVVDGQAQAAIWAGQPLHEEPVALDWTLDGQPLGEGWGLPVPASAAGQQLALTATAPDGTTRTATVTVASAPAAFSVTRQAVDLDGAWRLDDRRQQEAESDDLNVIPEGQAARLTPALTGDLTARWMLPAGQGTLLQFDDTRTDLLREALTFEDGELEQRRAVEPGVATALALARDGEGGNRWRWIQVAMGVDPGQTVRHEGFLLSADGASAQTGLLAVTLSDLDAESGAVTFADPVAVSTVDEHEANTCGPAPFRLAWLWEGRCTVDDVVGLRVVLEVE